MAQSASAFLDETPATQPSAEAFLSEPGAKPDAESFLGSAPATKTAPTKQQRFAAASPFERLKMMVGDYAPAALKVHEANAPSPFLEQIMPRIEMPDVSVPVMGIPFNPSIAVAPINALASVAKGLSNPEMAPILSGMGAVSAAGRLVPGVQRLAQIAEVPLQGYFGVDMAKGAMEQAKRTGEMAADPGVTLGQTIESGLETGASALFSAGATRGAIGSAKGALAARVAGKTPEQAVKAIREEIKVTEDKAAADALTDVADTLDREITAREAQQKVVDDAQKAQETALKEAEKAAKAQQKAAADAQKRAAQLGDEQAKAAIEAAKPPKSQQILAEAKTPPPIANVATEIGTQTSPFALQGKLNELTAPKPAEGQVGAVAPASPEGQIAVPVETGIAPPEAVAPKIKAPSKAKIEQLAESKNIPWDYDPEFMAFTKQLTGKEHISDLNPQERTRLYQAIEARPDMPSVLDRSGRPTGDAEAKVVAEQRKALGLDENNKPVASAPEAATPAAGPFWLDPSEFAEYRERQKALIKAQGKEDMLKELGAGIKEIEAAEAERRIASDAYDEIGGDYGATGRGKRKGNAQAKQPTKGEPTNASSIKSSTPLGEQPIGTQGARGEGGQRVEQGVQGPEAPRARQEAPQTDGGAPAGAVDEAVLTPPAMMKPAARLAELQERGVTTYKGKALKDLTGAESMNALGLAREGKLMDEPVRTSDKIINALQKAKIRKPGQLSAAVEPFSIAYDAALDVAILAIRAGRSLAEVVQTALAKFRTMHPSATEADIARLSKDIEKAHGDKANEQIQAQRTMPGDSRGVSKSSLGKYDYIKTTNKGQLEAGQAILDYVAETGDYDGGFARLRSIQNTADRSVAAALLLAEAEKIADPLLRDRTVARLFREAKDSGTDAAQALQAQSVVNELIGPYRAHLAWMDIIQSRLEAEVAPKMPPGTETKINTGFKAAGNAAAERLAVDAPGAESLLRGPMRRIQAASSINWRDVFTDLPENQVARKAEIFNRIKADPKIAALPEATQRKLADAMEQAWESIRNNIFRQEFGKLVDLPNIPKPDAAKLERSLPEIIKQANLGLLDHESFLNALGKQYGIENLDSATGRKLRELGQKAQRTPEGSERNEVFQEMLDTIMQARGVNPWDFLKDLWYRNVMSAPRTAVEIGAGGIIQGGARTFLTALDTAIIQRRPDIAARMIGMFLRDAGTGMRLGADLIASGDRAILPRYTEQFLAKMDRLEKGESPGGEIESLYRRSGPVGKTLLFAPEMVGRVLTALDYIGGQGVRSQQMLYAALTRGDKASFDAAMKRFNAEEVTKADARARTELGPQARPAQVIARTREILNEGISKEIRDFGNHMTEVTALNAPPVGIAGLLYNAVLAKLPLWVKAPTGLAFAKAGLNLAQEYSNWMPLTGQVNAARALWKNPSPNNPFRSLALDKLRPERARQIIAAQATGLVLTGVMASKFLSDQPEDKEGKPRKWEISGSWAGLSPTQKAALLSAGEKQYAIKLPSGRWVDYKLTPLVGNFAIIGNMRDQQRFNGKKWDEKTVTGQVVNSWLAGLASIKDLSLASQAAQLAGYLASDTREIDETVIEKRIADSLGNAATGLIPMNSLLREVDNYFDQQRYRTDRQNPGVDLWLKQVPFVRRLVGEGEDSKNHPMLNFLGEPVKVVVTPFNRHIGELPSDKPVERALSDKVSVGMRLPAMSDNTTIVALQDGKPAQRPMTADENYFYQKAVRQGFASQLASDLPAFIAATPEQAALYSQAVFSGLEGRVRDQMNTGASFIDGAMPPDPRLSSALTPDYQQVRAMDADEAAPSAMDRSRLRVEYDKYRGLPNDQKGAQLRALARTDPEFAMKLLKYAMAPANERTALEKATGGLGADTRADYYANELAKLPTPEAKQKFLQQQFKAGLLSLDVMQEMAKQRAGKN